MVAVKGTEILWVILGTSDASEPTPKAEPLSRHWPAAGSKANAGAYARRDPLSGTPVVVASGRQGRPNLPRGDCPFCPGGLEAPEPYDVRWFKNRWPPLADERCEVLIFSPRHSASLGSLDLHQLSLVVGLWTERTQVLGARDDVSYVLLFENRGAEVGATIPHPHGQAYGFADVPPVALRELDSGRCALCEEVAGKGPAGPSHPGRVVAVAGGWRSWAVWAPSYPFELLVAPDEHLADLAAARASADGLVAVLKGSLGALDGLFQEPMPYMLWCHQRPSDGKQWPTAHVHFHVAPTLRARGVSRYVASGELGSGVMFNPVSPDDAARQLRASLTAGTS